MTDYFICTPDEPLISLVQGGRERYVRKSLSDHAAFVKSTALPAILKVMDRGSFAASDLLGSSPFRDEIHPDDGQPGVLKAPKPDLQDRGGLAGGLAESLRVFFSNEGEGIVDRDRLSDLLSVVAGALDQVEVALREKTGRPGATGPPAQAPRPAAAGGARSERPDGGDVPRRLLDLAAFLNAVRRGAMEGIHRGRDLGVYKTMGFVFLVTLDHRRLVEAFDRRDTSYLRSEIEKWIKGTLPAVQEGAEKELAGLDDQSLLARTYNRSSVEVWDDKEWFGHYLAQRAGFPLAARRPAGYTKLQELDDSQVSALGDAVAEVAAGRLHEPTVQVLGDEILGDDERVKAALDEFSGDETNESVRKRKKLEKFVNEAKAGKKKIFYIHREEA